MGLSDLQLRHIIRSSHKTFGWLLDFECYDDSSLGCSSNAQAVWWECSCGKHFTYILPASAREAERKGRDPFYCIRCNGDLPSTRITPATSDGEWRLRNLLDVGQYEYAVHVHPWKGCRVAVDAYLPLQRIVICHDGRSHFAPMPTDRKDAASKAYTGGQLVIDAVARGFKVVRLHYKDENEWADAISSAIATWKDTTPLYTSSYSM